MPLNTILTAIDKLEKKQFESKMYSDYEDQFQIFLMAAFLFLVIGWIVLINFLLYRKERDMAKIKTSYVPGSAFKKYASSFWLDRDFDTSFKSGGSVDYTKLAAAQRAIGNFVNIVTGQQIPVVFQNNDASYTDGNSVTIGTKLDGTNFDPAVGLALHEGSHIAYTDFSLFKTPSGTKAYTLSATKFASILNNTDGIDSVTLDEKKYGIIKDLLNWIEDRRIDYKIYTLAPGYRMYYESMYPSSTSFSVRF